MHGRLLFFLLMITSYICTAQVWQWSVPMLKARNAASRAFLWIPPDCKKVKAVVVTQNNMEELSIVENDYFRKAMQDLAFDIPLKNQNAGTQTILRATSDAGLPVNFYVKEGPAVIKNNKLVITAIPPYAKYPVKITVVAWQYGKSAEPAVQTAVPVEQTFYVIQ